MSGHDLDRGLRLLATLWAGVMAGFFWSFSTVVMPGLALADPQTALASMQAINAAVRNALFATGFFGAPLLCVLVAIRARALRDGTSARLALAGSTVYLLGVFTVTSVGNVPLNRALALLDPALTESGAAMTVYIREWTGWNDLRTVAGTIAFVLLAASTLRPTAPDTAHQVPHGPPAQG
ncbi:anthrone oxygenase family protein [Azospirillum rugosum]|uniref:Membrane protein n=1 Tax=Azospirillum rugosum TaxID=416170 RepID=A0ABS4SPW9_9PROT|nr:anthrone oxygenase family protein [Azospirillum rugosum]MBP2293440.1 putative membrane protein [Azospirillum rugosum]MDQ0530211.1 putative membrane protein [Azospirillum rugosum]